MVNSEHSESSRVQQQSSEEWLAELGGAHHENLNPKPMIINFPSEQEQQKIDFRKRVRKAGIIYIRLVGEKLLITTDRNITKELDNKIKKYIHQLAKIAEPDRSIAIYRYTGYRTLFHNINRLSKPCLAIEFVNVLTGELAVRYFNIELKNNNGKSFKIGRNGEFRIVGSIKRPTKGSFIKFWNEAVQYLPDNRVSHISRYMNPMLSNLVVSCSDSTEHHDIIKLSSLKIEGYLYDV